jgi:hypothetical protein
VDSRAAIVASAWTLIEGDPDVAAWVRVFIEVASATMMSFLGFLSLRNWPARHVPLRIDSVLLPEVTCSGPLQ